MLALGSAIFFFYIVIIKYNRKRTSAAHLVSRKNLIITLRLIAIVVACIIMFVVLYYADNRFVVHNYQRWIKLFKTAGGPRLQTQPQYFLSMMNTTDYFMGLSKPVINQSAITYGVEVEPINIFVTFGAIGFILQYLLVFILIRYFYRSINKTDDDRASLCLIISSYVGLFTYQVFSVGYFFFREIRVGLFPWVLMGVAIGYYTRLKKNQRIQPIDLLD